MADQTEIVRKFISAAASNPSVLQDFEQNPEQSVQKAAQSNGIDLSGVNINDVISAVQPLVSGGQLDVSAITKVAGELFNGSHPAAQESGGLEDILGALGNVFGSGTAHEDKKNEQGGIDLSALGGLAASLFGGK